eukprot:1353461-Amorphochlora_amoeboformis.AAC.2
MADLKYKCVVFYPSPPLSASSRSSCDSGKLTSDSQGYCHCQDWHSGAFAARLDGEDETLRSLYQPHLWGCRLTLPPLCLGGRMNWTENPCAKKENVMRRSMTQGLPCEING